MEQPLEGWNQYLGVAPVLGIALALVVLVPILGQVLDLLGEQ